MQWGMQTAHACGALVASIATCLTEGVAAEAVWIGTQSGLWTNPMNWQDSLVPPDGGASDLILRFTKPGRTGIIATNDLGAPFDVNQLIVESERLSTFQISSAPQNSLRFAGTAPEIKIGGPGNLVIGPVQLASAVSELKISGAGWGNLQIGEIRQTEGSISRLLVNAPAPTVDSHLIRLAPQNALGGGIILEAGNLQVTSERSLGQGDLLANGGTLQFNNPYTVVNPVRLGSDLVITQGGGATMTGVISSAVPGSGLIVERIASASGFNPFATTGADLTLTGVSTYNGPTIIRRGLALSGLGGAGVTRLFLSGAGSLLNSSRYEVGAESTFVINGTNSGANRLNDTAPILLAGGDLNFRGTIASERVGPLAASGYASVTYGESSFNSGRASVSAPELNRVDRGTLLLRGASLGAESTGPGNRLTVDVAPVMVGAGGEGSDRSIVPWAIGGSSATSGGSDLVTYDATRGFRLLANSEYAATIAGLASAGNVRLAGRVSTDSAVSMNALVLQGATLNGNGPLEIRSGTVLSTQSSTIGNDLNFGHTEALLFTSAPLTLHGAVSGTNGITKSGTSSLVLAGANSFTGPLTVNAGSLAFTSLAGLGNDNGPILLGATTNRNGNVAGLQWAGSGTVQLDRNIVVTGGYGLLSGDHDKPDSPLVYGGVISGAGGLQVSGPKVTLTRENTYSGGTQLFFGETVIASDAALGTGTLDLRGGKLTLQTDWEPTRNIIVAGGAINTAGFNARIRGYLSGAGTLTKRGEGVLQITTAQPFSGALNVAGGTLELSGAGDLSRVREIGVVENGTLSLDDTAVALSHRLDSYVGITLGIGRLSLRGDGSTEIRQTIRTLVLKPHTGKNLLTLEGAGTGRISLAAGTLSLEGDLLLRGSDLGGRERLVVSTAPADAGRGIVAGLFTAGAAGNVAEAIGVHDLATDAHGAIGVRAMRPDEMTIATDLGNPVNGGAVPADANLLLSSAAATAGEINTVNSITLDEAGALQLSAGHRLRVASGVVLVRSSAQEAALTGPGTLDFAGAKGVMYIGNDTVIASGLAGRAGVRKTGPGVLTYTGAADFLGALTVNEGKLRIGATHLQGATVAPELGGTLELQDGGATVGRLTGGGHVDLGSNTLTVGALPDDMLFTGTFSGAGGVVIKDGGNANAVRELDGASTFTGGVVLNSGRLTLSNPKAGGTGSLTINGGALYNGLSASPFDQKTITQPTVVNSTLRIEGTGITAFAESAPLTGSGGIDVRSSGGLNIESASSHLGATRVLSASSSGLPSATMPSVLRLSSAAGALTATSAVILRGGSSLQIDGTGSLTGPAGRLHDGVSVSLHSSELQLNGQNLLPTAERIGSLTISGSSVVTIVSSGATVLTTTALLRENGGTALLRGLGLGSASAEAPGQFLLDGASSLELVGGGGSGPQSSIVPFAIGDLSATGKGTGLVSYDTERGFRVLNPSTDYVTSLEAASPTTNLRLTSSVELTADTSVNALVLATSGVITGTGRLTVESGMIVTALTSSSISADVDFGSREANIFTAGTSGLSLTGQITGSGGWTKSGAGGLALTNTNPITGPLTINEGTVYFSSMDTLGDEAAPIRFNSTSRTGGLVYTGSAPLDFTRNIEIIDGFAPFDGRGRNVTISGVISGSGGFVSNGFGPLTLAGQNTYTGQTIVQCPLIITGDSALGVGGSVELANSQLTLAGGWTTNREVLVSRTSTLNTGGNVVVLSGAIVGSTTSSLSIIGAGDVSVNDMSQMAGAVYVESGTLRLNGILAPGGSMTVGTAATLTGDADIRRSLAVFGTISPSNGGGTMKMEGLSLYGNSTLDVRLDSPSVFDRLLVNGEVSLEGGIQLALTLGYEPVEGQSFRFLDNGGSDPINRNNETGRFFFGSLALDEGTQFLASGQEFSITYLGGDGNDVVLFAVPEPGSLGLVAAGALLLGATRRRRTCARC